MTKRLIIAPHVDDDVIGCGGILGPDCMVFYCGVDDFHVVSRADRLEEAKKAQNLGKYITELPHPSFPVNHYQEHLTELIQHFENQIFVWQPDEVLFPWPSYNQDHQAVYKAAMVATRPHDQNHFVKRVLLYEEPDCMYHAEQFRPDVYREIDIIRKLELYNLMASQVRGHRSPEHIKALAQVRGAASNYAFAEAFQVVRWVE